MTKDIWKTMLIISVCTLIGMYFLKLVFPNEFLLAIENERIVQLGNFIDNHRPLYYIFAGLTAFATYYLYCGACCHRLKLNWKELLMILCCVIVMRLLEEFDKNRLLYTHINYSIFLILPALMKGHLKTTAIVYFTHGLSQILSLSIRDLPLYLSTTNTLTIILLSLDMYFWLLVMFVLFNRKEE